MTNEQAMSRALELARRGQGRVSPNPLVGCVILEHDQVIAEGWHQAFGSEHAEAAALRSAHRSVQGATLVCNLEPCSHVGRNPACADRIIEAGIARVVIGCGDPNPLVSGNGINKLRAAGIDVVEGVLESECLWINRAFRYSILHRSPYCIVKVAETLDGNLKPAPSSTRWISSESSRTKVHALRSECDAVLIGADTAISDNPHLTLRLVHGEQPYRIVLDSSLRCPLHLDLFNDEFRDKTIILTTEQSSVTDHARNLKAQGVSILPCPHTADAHLSLSDSFTMLYQEFGIQSLLIEAGPTLSSVLLRQDLCHELHSFVAPILGGRGPHVFQHQHALRSASDEKALPTAMPTGSRVFALHMAEASGADLHMIHLRAM